ncbi:MAG: GGDEF domain-containing protein [Burkholderiales bacterium]|nr:GGDEF domain-containing protein [Burkholderiales bacterium]
MNGQTVLTLMGDRVLGSERVRRQRISRFLLTLPAFVAGIGLLHYARHLGLSDGANAWWLTWYVAGGLGLFYALLRMGWAVHSSDPDLMIERSVFAIVALLMVYAWGGSARSNALLLLSLVVVQGMFTLSPRQTLVVGGLSVLLLGLTMAYISHQDPQRYPPLLELLRFILVAFGMIGLSMVARQVQQLRRKLVQQKAELQVALERVQRLGQRDALTDLVNRRHMLELIEYELKRQARGHAPACCVAMVDLDWFKRINDTHGHAVGDQVLRGFAHVTTKLLRTTDVVARWGGEEFLILLPCTDLPQAMATLERLRLHLCHARLAEDIVPKLQVTVSIGVAQHQHGELLDHFLDRADQAMYAAKSAGRNVVRSAPMDVSDVAP